MLSKIYLIALFLASHVAVLAQDNSPAKTTFNRQDSLRGTLSPLRACYDVKYYDLNLKVKPKEKTISGYNAITFRAVSDFTTMQVDLFENFTIDMIVFGKKFLKYKREGSAFFIQFEEVLKAGQVYEIKIYYQGQPRVAPNPPWDGGFTWTKDKQGNDWVGVSCQGLGASVWFPNKDHLSDEPDSMRIYCEVPAELMCKANGKMVSVKNISSTEKGYEYKVSYPINNYNVTLNIGKYAYFSDTYTSKDGESLQLNYYVLEQNAEKAKPFFAQQVNPMLAAFEKYFGKYPFWRDGYALVETPYWGMEHQSAIAYGNNYRKNDFGFDFIIVHESGHEYFGNSLSIGENAELWLHESFTTYAEALYVEYLTNYDNAVAYLLKQKASIKQNDAMLPRYFGVNYNHWRDSDIYFKGTWMLHSLRNVVSNDALWFATLREMCEKFKHSQVNTEKIIDFMSQKTNKNLRPIFYEYLKHTTLPVLEYKLKGKKLEYRWRSNEPNFDMPLRIAVKDDKFETIYPTKMWQKIKISPKNSDLSDLMLRYLLKLEKID